MNQATSPAGADKGAASSNDAFEWSDGMLVGYPALDATHKEFVEVVNQLLSCTDDNALERLDAFAAHAQAHFGQENEWMASTKFPPMDCHVDEHAAVLKSVTEVRAKVAEGEAGAALVRDLAEHLAAWFPGHTSYLDSALSTWMSKLSHGGAPVVIRRNVARGD